MMKILFFGTKSYDEKYFKEDLAQERFQEIDVHFIEPDLTPA